MALKKAYEHKSVEAGKYKEWKKKGYFTAGDKTKKPYSLVLPPPNVTGVLHLGHALDTTYQDILARYKKAQGYDVLWLPGMDHAGIATQIKVEEALYKERGLTRFDLGREAFLEEAWNWKHRHADHIRDQWEVMGLMLDYTREKFTLDKDINKAVNKVFVDLYNKGLIYQGVRIINWDPKLTTALSNMEVIHKEIKGNLYYFKYYLENSSFYLEVATTRPETMFADVCLVVNKKDKRYKDYVGKMFINPVNGEKIPLITDDYVDPSFGTGVMKCTPAHDPNDFTIGVKYNLEMPNCIAKDGTMNDRALEFRGLDRFECRKKLLAKMKKLNLFTKKETITHSVGHSERSDAIIEPYLSKQWFIKMSPLAKRALKNQASDKAVKFFPPRFNKVFIRWMENAEDWCISRQLWWGHPIPAYTNKITGKILVSETPPKDIENYIQDEDVLDTWFSSALWPFTTLGWPNKTSDLGRYFPLDVMVTGYDIIFFWASRMIFQSLEFTKQVPFKDCVIHGLVRDEIGRKMSKSLGNGVDPMDVIEEYGCDALRYFLATGSTPGQDIRFSHEKVSHASAYLNKIWNAARYIFSILPSDYKVSKIDEKKLHPTSKFILDRLNVTIRQVTRQMDRYQFGLASEYLYHFVYDDFCSNYIEISKVLLKEDPNNTTPFDVLVHVLKAVILMIYPFTPFISEELYLNLPTHLDSIMLESYPTSKGRVNKKVEEEVLTLIELIKEVRHFKSQNKLAPNELINVYLSDLTFDFTPYIAIFKRLAFIEEVHIGNSPKNLVKIVVRNLSMALELHIDKDLYQARLNEQLENLEKEVIRSEKMLHNPNFLAKAPEAKIKEEQEKYELYKEQLAKVKEEIKNLK